MKVLSFVLILIFCSSTSGVVINCKFQNTSWQVIGSVYSCEAQSLSEISVRNVTNITGTHQSGMIDADVEVFEINIRNDLTFVPHGVEQFFPNLIGLQIGYSQIRELIGDELKNYPNLEFFSVHMSPLERISGDLFQFNPLMRLLWFQSNRIQHVGEQLFEPLNVSRLERVNFFNNVCTDKDAIGYSEIVQLIKDMKTQCNNKFYSHSANENILKTNFMR